MSKLLWHSPAIREVRAIACGRGGTYPRPICGQVDYAKWRGDVVFKAEGRPEFVPVEAEVGQEAVQSSVMPSAVTGSSAPSPHVRPLVDTEVKAEVKTVRFAESVKGEPTDDEAPSGAAEAAPKTVVLDESIVRIFLVADNGTKVEGASCRVWCKVCDVVLQESEVKEHLARRGP